MNYYNVEIFNDNVGTTHYEVSEKLQSHLLIVILPKRLRLVSLKFDNFNDALNLNTITVKMYDMFNIFEESACILYSH